VKFYPESHTYIDDQGRLVMSVTQILRDSGRIDDRWFTEEARERGTLVHQFCEQYAKGFRDDERTPRIDGYVGAFIAWMEQARPYVIAAEKFITNTIDGLTYAGKFDLLVDVRGEPTLYDIKTGGKAPWHKSQVAAYALVVKPKRCGILYLAKDGRFKEDIFTGAALVEGIEDFKDALHAAQRKI
jgi:hypothetical protein